MPPPQKTPAKELTRIEQLLDVGNYNEALQVVETLEQRDDLPPTDRFACHLHRSTILKGLGQYEEGLRLAEIVLKESQRRRKRLYVVDALIARAEALIELGRFDAGLDAIEQGDHELATLTRD